jgi:hypothetical protein
MTASSKAKRATIPADGQSVTTAATISWLDGAQVFDANQI